VGLKCPLKSASPRGLTSGSRYPAHSPRYVQQLKYHEKEEHLGHSDTKLRVESLIQGFEGQPGANVHEAGAVEEYLDDTGELRPMRLFIEMPIPRAYLKS
jgi:hypothetical protein